MWEPKIRIGWNGYSQKLRDRTMPAHNFQELKDLLLVDLPEGKEESKLDEPTGDDPTTTNFAGPGE